MRARYNACSLKFEQKTLGRHLVQLKWKQTQQLNDRADDNNNIDNSNSVEIIDKLLYDLNFNTSSEPEFEKSHVQFLGATNQFFSLFRLFRWLGAYDTERLLC